MEKIEIDMKWLVNFSFIFIRGNVLREGRAQLRGNRGGGCHQGDSSLIPLTL